MSFLRRLRNWLRELGGGEREYLCDTCRYDHPHACHRRERPNATECADYKRR